MTERPEVVVADAGYWHQVQTDNIVCRGVKVLIPPDSRKRQGARPGWGGGAYAFMRRVLQTDAGRELSENAKRRSSRSSDTPSSTGGSTASNDEEEPPAAPNGG